MGQVRQSFWLVEPRLRLKNDYRKSFTPKPSGDTLARLKGVFLRLTDLSELDLDAGHRPVSACRVKLGAV